MLTTTFNMLLLGSTVVLGAAVDTRGLGSMAASDENQLLKSREVPITSPTLDVPLCEWDSEFGSAIGWEITIPGWTNPGWSPAAGAAALRAGLGQSTACQSYVSFQFQMIGANSGTLGMSFHTDDFCTDYDMTAIIKSVSGRNIPCVPNPGSNDPPPMADTDGGPMQAEPVDPEE